MDYVSNTPVSGPVDLKINPDADMNGIMWSNRWGLIFKSAEEQLPFRLPVEPELF